MFRTCVMALALLAAALGACSSRSISNSGYQEDGYYGRNAFYQGEIDELDLFVPQERDQKFGGDIKAALADNRPVAAELGKPLLVVQSGALVPDEFMTDALKHHFQVSPFSGVPSRPAYPHANTASTAQPGSFGERLRLAAAQGGYRHILVYWGELEALRSGGVTKAISWVPIVGAVVPDESQDMRIRLKAAIIEVETGRWRMILPESIENSAISASINRASSDQGQVERLKAAGYAKLADMIVAEAGAASPPS
ncbi:aminopeptidase [Dongia deserti]|uniref:aminopeptidase n=1 Tax=Dongia deserti TaxID=2268030 RepID=UPI0013C53824|nr:aminopeptidase [Dongia deserti]